MNTTEQVKDAIATFVKAGDTNDVSLLEHILHPQFHNVQDGFFNEHGIFIFSKEDYKALVGSKRFGGAPRTIQFDSVNIDGNLAYATVQLESSRLKFNSTINLCHTNGQWKVIHNIPRIVPK
ncbi:nuclear transport factor 2 family protein [Pseudochryseolinea flava]|uniref:Nuclear transport factor 2 family protein n=1 Tax=Pseudochryseolinea flava TaxID=2059302 RepID=A0A364Y7I7_9BACT|nr:nuclear transport factor 2 family protein [Pseudochryseolinea flava]RAW02863.1 hypothetical protein DQQ10_01780 [Pseudochryseolinea flava]